jgi:hypothetical protein
MITNQPTLAYHINRWSPEGYVGWEWGRQEMQTELWSELPGIQSIGKPRQRWEDNTIHMALKATGCEDG